MSNQLRARLERRSKLTFYFLDLFQEAISQALDPDEDEMNAIVIDCARLAGLPMDTEAQIEAFCLRLNEFSEEVAPAADEPSQVKPKRAFGTQFLIWVSQLDHSETCAYLADYDLDKAARYYQDEDVTDIRWITKLKADHEWENAVVAMDACVYGFGGSYDQTDAAAVSADEFNGDMGAALDAFMNNLRV